jgi:endonuclease YncB( thermonuclease family)
MERSKQLIGSILLWSVFYLPVAAQPQMITGKVISVVDGDTITILDTNNQKLVIRLEGIDAPELNQEFGSRSKQSLSDLVNGKTVNVLGPKKDQYGLIVGKIALDSKDINFEQIDRGMAWFYRPYAKELAPEDAKAYERAELNAKEDKRGLWRNPNPMPPWQYMAITRSAPSGVTKVSAPADGQIIGIRKKMIYYMPDCPDYNKAPERNREYYKTAAEAEAAGFKKAKSCP